MLVRRTPTRSWDCTPAFPGSLKLNCRPVFLSEELSENRCQTGRSLPRTGHTSGSHLTLTDIRLFAIGDRVRGTTLRSSSGALLRDREHNHSASRHRRQAATDEALAASLGGLPQSRTQPAQRNRTARRFLAELAAPLRSATVENAASGRSCRASSRCSPTATTSGTCCSMPVPSKGAGQCPLGHRAHRQ